MGLPLPFRTPTSDSSSSDNTTDTGPPRTAQVSDGSNGTAPTGQTTGITPLLPTLAVELGPGEAGCSSLDRAAKPEGQGEHTMNKPNEPVTPGAANREANEAECSPECLREGDDDEDFVEEVLVEGVDTRNTTPAPAPHKIKPVTPGSHPFKSSKHRMAAARKCSSPRGQGGEEGDDVLTEGKKNRRASMAQRRRRDREKKLHESRERAGEEDDDYDTGDEEESEPHGGPKARIPAGSTLGLSQGFLVPLPPPDQRQQERTCPPALVSATAMEIKAVSDVVNHKCAGGGGEFFAENERGVQMYDLDAYTTEGEDEDFDDTTVDLDKTVVLEVGKLVAEEIRPEENIKLRARGSVAFVVLKFDPDHDKHWTVPEPELFHDLMNRVEGGILENDLKCGEAYKWISMWGKVGLLGLDANKMEQMNEYRDMLERQTLGKIRFTLFPKEALEKKGNISVLLRASYKSFKAEWLPKAIMRRTRQLRGSLRLTHVKTYADGDVSRAGASKRGWRLALLQGCPRFMFSLEKFGQDHLFPVGSGQVLIRGGSNRPKGKGRRREGDRPGRNENGPTSSGHQRQSRHSASEKTGEKTTEKRKDSYDRSFPTGGLRSVSYGGNMEWGTRTTAGQEGRSAPR